MSTCRFLGNVDDGVGTGLGPATPITPPREPNSNNCLILLADGEPIIPETETTQLKTTYNRYQFQ